MKKIFSPLSKEDIKALKQDDIVLLSGVIYTARDAAHKKMLEHLQKTGEMLLKGQTVYYAGPCPPKEGDIVGSAGPTTSYRMDAFTPLFLQNGILATIGKGQRNQTVIQAIKKHGGVHFDAIGGAGAYYKNCIKSCQAVYFPELGTEAVYRLEVEDFPCIVSII
ncbi:MAG: FumA C-terminus/TtdB family hydratase beta subunit [Christensenellales bacterium]|jgi:fumarate hydratase subunit beta